MEGAIIALNDLLTSRAMFVVWSVPFVLGFACHLKNKDARCMLVALLALTFMIYFGWAMTGMWNRHEVALAFNRSAQIIAAFIAILLILSMIDGRK